METLTSEIYSLHDSRDFGNLSLVLSCRCRSVHSSQFTVHTHRQSLRFNFQWSLFASLIVAEAGSGSWYSAAFVVWSNGARPAVILSIRRILFSFRYYIENRRRCCFPLILHLLIYPNDLRVILKLLYLLPHFWIFGKFRSPFRRTTPICVSIGEYYLHLL